jgi:hypothetical protein
VVLSYLLHHCGFDLAPPYQDLAPALHAALQHNLGPVPALAQAVLLYHTSSMASDQQLIGLILDKAEQGEGSAAAVLAAVVPLACLVVEPGDAARTLVHDRVTALLAGGTAAGAAFLTAGLLAGGILFEAPGMLEAACSGLLAACNAATAVEGSIISSSSSSKDSSSRVRAGERACLADLPPAHTVLLQYLRGLVGVVLHLATELGSPLSDCLAEEAGPLVPALAEVLSLLLSSLQLPGSSSWDRYCTYGYGQRPYHDAAWAALLALSECPGTAALVAAVVKHQPALLEGLESSWNNSLYSMFCEEPYDMAARLAACLLLSGSVPGQEERQQLEGLLEAALQLWETPGFWHRRAGMLMELLRLPQGPAAVMHMPSLLVAIFTSSLLGPHQQEGWALLMATPVFATQLLEGLGRQQEEWLAVVEAVWESVEPAHTLALLAIPGLGDALAQCCNIAEDCCALDWILGDALTDEVLQAYLAQQPVLLQALVARLRLVPEHSSYLWDCLGEDDSGDGWLLGPPWVMDGVVAGLVVARCYPALAAAERLLDAHPAMLESLLRQPSAVEGLLRVLVRHYWRPPPDRTPCGFTQLRVLEALADSHLAPQALVLLPGLLAKGDAELSVGVFEAMHLIQSRMAPGSMDWCQDLAATSSSGAEVLGVEGQLQSLRQGAEEVQRATAAAAAATRQLQEQLQQQQEQQQQPAQQVLDSEVRSPVPQQVGSSSRKRKAHLGQSTVAAAGSLNGVEGRLAPQKSVPHGSGAQEASKPAARSRKRTPQ